MNCSYDNFRLVFSKLETSDLASLLLTEKNLNSLLSQLHRDNYFHYLRVVNLCQQELSFEDISWSHTFRAISCILREQKRKTTHGIGYLSYLYTYGLKDIRHLKLMERLFGPTGWSKRELSLNIAAHGSITVLQYAVSQGLDIAGMVTKMLQSAAEAGQLEMYKYLLQHVGKSFLLDTFVTCLRTDKVNILEYAISEGDTTRYFSWFKRCLKSNSVKCAALLLPYLTVAELKEISSKLQDREEILVLFRQEIRNRIDQSKRAQEVAELKRLLRKTRP